VNLSPITSDCDEFGRQSDFASEVGLVTGSKVPLDD